MTTSSIEMTLLDHHRLSDLLDRKAEENGCRDENLRTIRTLGHKLANACTRDATPVSPDVVAMGSTVRLLEIDTGEQWKFMLCYPSNANIDEGRISVLAPLGTAILGQRVGDTVDWSVPSGMIRIQIVEVIYQPDAAGTPHESDHVLK